VSPTKIVHSSCPPRRDIVISLQCIILILRRERVKVILSKVHSLAKRKKKKEEKLPVIQNMTSVGLDASKKDKVQVLGRSPMTMILLWWWR